ncbi:MAG TPA: NPCBM/NEW2 domain-containing protein [Tepidisphaeraceae bacterium]|nr:NPCBM/NEW2 domain-containing protein [Tepidisphaeraceae bacterium]
MPRNRRIVRASQKTVSEALESRCLLSGNIHMVGVSLVDQSFNPISTPSAGSQVYLKIDFTTVGLPANATYNVSPTVNGYTSSFPVTWGAGNPGTDNWSFYYGLFPIVRGTATASATLDPLNNVAETNESDNTGSITYTGVQLPFTGKMAQPIAGVAERTYSYASYVDVNSSSPGFADYRGGPLTYDGHAGIDMTVSSFTDSDAGIPIIATLGGTVVVAQDGYYDRNTGGSFDAGNYVEIDSGNGYQEYYYHLREGSVGVQVGQTVQQGQVIGLMGASGNAFGAHLHFEMQNGGAFEPFQDPFTYWQNPVPYQGDVEAVIDSGITNYDPSSILNMYERPPEYRNFKQQSGQTAYAWFKYDSAAGEPVSITYYRPNGTVYIAANFTSFDNAGGYTYVGPPLPSTPDLGTWQVAFSLNGKELARNSFTVGASGAAAVRVDFGSTFIANNRETPIDGGTFAQGNSATTLNLTVTNYGNFSMSPGNLTLPAGWTVVDGLAPTIAAGATDTVSVKVDTSMVGYRYGYLSFTTNDPNAPTYSFALEGTVNPTAATPAVSIYTRNSAASETGLQPGVVRVRRTGDTSSSLVVNLNITGTAGNGSDYSTVGATVTIPAGQSTASVIVTPINDSSPESTETAIISLGAGSYVAGVNNTATINIADNDSTGTASITGTVYLDKNFNTYQDSGEGAVQGVVMFLDNNSNGVLDAGEPQTTTNASGVYTFSSLPAGFYNVRASSTAYILSTPVGAYSVATGQTLTVNLGAFPISFTGTGNDDVFTIAPATTNNRELITAGGITYNAIRSQLPSLTFSGAGGNDTFTIDASMLSAPPGIFSTTPITWSGGTGTNSVTIVNTSASQDLNVQASQLAIAGTTVSFTGTQVILDGTYGSAVPLNSLTVGSGTVSLATNKSLALKVGTVSLSGTGSLNLANNDMIVTGMIADSVRALLAGGYANGAWTGTGINSSAVASVSGSTLGFALASDIGSPATFDGQPVIGSNVLVRYTLGGDANLDRTVDLSDMIYFAPNWFTTANRFSQGDFNYDGTVNAKDLTILAHNNQQHITPPSPAAPLAQPIEIAPAGPALESNSTVYLSDLTPTSAVNGWGTFEKDRSNGEAGSHDGHGIALNGKSYDKGLGVHAGSTIVYNLDGKYSQFLADIGVDDEVGSKGSVVFHVYADNRKIYDSGKMTGNSVTQSVGLDVAGARQLKLVVTDSGNGRDFDHADWANARLLLQQASNTSMAAVTSSTGNKRTAKLSDLVSTVPV